MKTKKDARSLTRSAQEALRLRAIKALRRGMTQYEAVQTFEVSRAALNKWIKQYRQGGQKALRTQVQGRPKGQKQLPEAAAAEVQKLILDRTPDQLKLPFMLWTRTAVQTLISTRYGVEVSLMTIGRWLREWGFTPQKPLRKAWEQNPEEVEQWLKAQYPQIRRRAKREKAEIHWGDEMGLRSDHQTGTTYGLKGQTPVIAGTGQRWKLNLLSTVTNRGTLRWMVFRRRFTNALFIKFLNRLLQSARMKVFLIVDRHPVHRSKEVKTWVQLHSEKIEMFFLPAYSPQLNPDEYLNNDVKANGLGRLRPGSHQEMEQNLRCYLRSTQKQPVIVKRYFEAPPVRYAQM
jgi:transposase